MSESVCGTEVAQSGAVTASGAGAETTGMLLPAISMTTLACAEPVLLQTPVAVKVTASGAAPEAGVAVATAVGAPAGLTRTSRVRSLIVALSPAESVTVTEASKVPSVV
mgnify:CR=1 FL=1